MFYLSSLFRSRRVAPSRPRFAIPTWFTLLALVFGVGCGATDESDTYRLVNVNGYTLTSEGELSRFEAIGIRDGIVETVGSTGDVRRAMPDVREEDGLGRVMLPGLIDAHAHVMGLGNLLSEVDVSGMESLEETLQAVREFAEENPDAPWILGRGWNQVLWEGGEFPTAQDLDLAVPDRPVYLSRVDGHAGWVNSVALQMAGVSRDTPDSRGGRLIRTPQGDPTGVFIDDAEAVVTRLIPPKSEAEREAALEAALDEMLAHGLTGVHDAGVDSATWALYRRFEKEGRLPMRIYAMVGGVGPATESMLRDGPVMAEGDDRLALRSVKLYADGALGSRGAALLRDYHDDPGNRGLLFLSAEEMTAQVARVLDAGFQANVHAIGDAANRQVLEALESAQRLAGQTPGEGRHRVEHAQVVAVEDIPRFAELGLIASMQPTHATSDMNMAEDRVGPQRILGAYAWQTFLGQGTVVAGGSDFPVEHVNPFYGLFSAITRQDHEGRPPQGWYPEEALSREQALRAFTLDAAYAAFDERRLGTLEPGKLADFIMIDRDPFTVPATEIWQTLVLETRVAGELVYRR